MKFAAPAFASLAVAWAVGSAPAAAPAPTTSGSPAATRPAAEPRQFLAKCELTRPAADGSPAAVVARPYILSAEGQSASISVGWDGAADVADLPSVGLQVTLCVKSAADGTLKAAVRLADAKRVSGDPKTPTVAETSVSTVRGVRFGEPVRLSLADGTTLAMTLTEAAERAAR